MEPTTDGERDVFTGQSYEGRTTIETKEFFRTSEFLLLIVAAAAIFITAAVAEGFDAEGAWTLVTFLSVAYMISRGLAKAGTGHPFNGRQRLNLRERFAEEQPYPPSYGYPQGYVPGYPTERIHGEVVQREPAPAYRPPGSQPPPTAPR